LSGKARKPFFVAEVGAALMLAQHHNYTGHQWIMLRLGSEN